MIVHGIIGHRSWIARSLEDVMDEAGITPAYVEKDEIISTLPMMGGTAAPILSHMERVHIIPGRARPSEDEMRREILLLQAIGWLPLQNQPRGWTYLTSRAVEDLSRYGSHKRSCDAEMRTAMRFGRMTPIRWIRAPAIFGPRQPVGSEMLVPSLARDPDVELHNPDLERDFVHVDDVAAEMVDSMAPPAPRIRASARSLSLLRRTWLSYDRMSETVF